MKLEDIKSLAEQDHKIDKSNLDRESLKTPELHYKYYNMYVDELVLLKKFEMDYKRLLKEKTDYYLGRCSDEVYKEKPLNKRILKQELDIYLDADSDMQLIVGKVEFQKIKCQYLEQFIKNVINSRSFHIRQAIDFLNFKNGVK